MKTCTKCGEMKSLDSFYLHKRDGVVSCCKTCARRGKKIYRQSHKTEIAESSRAYSQTHKRERSEYYQSHKVETAVAGKAYSQTEGGKKKRREAKRKYRLDFPAKEKAHGTVSNAIRDRRLEAPSDCESCFNERDLDGHHEDYSKPLEVDWLCRECHTKRHLELREILV